MEFLDAFIGWIESREGLLSGLAALVVVTGVFLSPLSRLAKKLTRSVRGLLGGTANGTETAPTSQPLAKPGAVGNRPKNERVSLVVLPLQAISTDPADAVLADALHEDLTTQLARVPGYFVISRTTALTYRDQSVPVEQLHEELGVRYALEGSVRRAQDSLRITAQLIDTETGGHIWAHNFDRPAADLLSLQNDLIAEIVNHLGSEINLAEVRLLEDRVQTNPSAYDEYTRALSVIHQTGWNKEGVSEALDYLGRATTLDPNFAPAISQSALLKALGSVFGLLDQPLSETKKDVVALAEKALALDNQSTDVLGFAGCALCDIGETDTGVTHLQRAMDIDPSNAQALAAFGWARILQGRAEEGVPPMEAAVRISPRAPGLAFWLYGLGMGLETLGRTNDVRDVLERAIRFDPKFPPPYPFLAAVLLREGDKAQAADLMARAKKVHPDLNAAGVRTIVPHNLLSALQDADLLPA